MDFTRFKIAEYQDNIKGLPDKIENRAAWLKAKFDGRTDKEVKESLNGLLDFLSSMNIAGIYVGESEPEDENINIWIDTSESSDLPFGGVTNERVSKLEKLLFSFSSASISPAASEIGSEKDLVVSWVCSLTPDRVTVNGTEVSESPYTLPEKATQTTQIKLIAYYGGVTAEKTLTAGFYPAIYYGGGSGTYTVDWAKGLSKTIKSSRSGTYTVSLAAGEFVCLVIPDSYGTPSATIGGFAYTAEKVASLSIANDYGIEISYSVWKVGQAVGGSQSVKVVIS